MKEFKKYRKKQFSEMREVTEEEIKQGAEYLKSKGISISGEDIKNGSPKAGDMIARNPKNHNDQWLVAKEYFEENFEEIKE